MAEKYKINLFFKRIGGIDLHPKTEWEIIRNESPLPWSIFFQYLLILSLIPPLCFLTGKMIFGPDFVFLKKIMLEWSLVETLSLFFSPLLGLWLTSFILKELPASLNEGISFSRFFQVIGYSLTPYWLTGFFYLVPYLDKFALAGGFYSLYLLYTGFSISLNLEGKKLIRTTAISAVALIITGVLFYRSLGAILHLVLINSFGI